jgi:predicted MFS family arabinose efflux permease
MAFIPSIVSPEKLMVANALSNTTRIIATILGFAAAGFLVSIVGHIWGFYLDAISYLFSAVLITVITPKKGLKSVKKELEITGEIIEKSFRKNIRAEIADGFKQMLHKNKMRIVTSVMFLIMAGAGSVFCILIVFVQKAFGTVTEALGIFGVFLGIGLFIGTVLFGKLGQRWSEVRTMFVCIFLCGIFISLFSVYSSGRPVFIISGILLCLLGIAVAPIFTSVQTLIHILVPDEVRGRIFSSMEAVMHFAFLIMMFLTAFLARYFSNLTILLFCAGAFAFLGLAGVIFYREKY